MGAVLTLAAAIQIALVAFAAGWLTHKQRTRHAVTALTGQIDELMASLASIPPEAIEHRKQVLLHNERRLHETRARLDAFHLLGGAA